MTEDRALVRGRAGRLRVRRLSVRCWPRCRWCAAGPARKTPPRRRGSRSSSPRTTRKRASPTRSQNTLPQDYPAGAAGESSSRPTVRRTRTDPIVRGRSRRASGWCGPGSGAARKPAQQLAIAEASGRHPRLLRRRHRAAPDRRLARSSRTSPIRRVGCVSSVDRFVDADGRAAARARTCATRCSCALETRVNSLVGLSGSFFAARRDVCRRWAPIARATSARC